MEHKTSPYILKKGNEYLVFQSEKNACEYLGVTQCTIASCYRSKSKCKGYEVIKGISESELYNNPRLRKIWESIHARCEYDKHPHFNEYGGRGITVCQEWDSYLPFAKWAFQHGYNDALSIDRINNEKGYSPNNCRWVTMKEQQNNRRNNRIIEYQGNKYTLTQLAEKIGISKTTLKERLNMGWSVEDAINRPVRLRTKGWRQSNGADMRKDGGT
jgi:hypothetical protein